MNNMEDRELSFGYAEFVGTEEVPLVEILSK